MADEIQIELTPEEIKAQELEKFEQALKDRAAELSKANGGVKVVPIWYADPADPINGKDLIGFLKEPNRVTKGSILDTVMVSQSRAAAIALNISFMKSESDERIISTNQLYDEVNLKAGYEALSFITIADSKLKKK